MENTKIAVKDQWAEKYIKDKIWMAYGSLLKAWGDIKHADKDYSLLDFLKDSDEIYKKARSHTINTYKIYEHLDITKENDNTPDIPTISK